MLVNLIWEIYFKIVFMDSLFLILIFYNNKRKLDIFDFEFFKVVCVVIIFDFVILFIVCLNYVRCRELMWCLVKLNFKG